METIDKSPSNGGFTIIELVTYIIIISIIAVLSGQVLWDDTHATAKVQSCRELVISELRHIQAYARASKIMQRGQFNIGLEELHIKSSLGGSWVVSKTIQLACEVGSTTFQGHTITYDGSGYAYEGSWAPASKPATPMPNDETVTLKASFGSPTQTVITVSKSTGVILK